MLQNSTAAISRWLIWVHPVFILNTFNTAPRLEITKELRKLGWRVDLAASGPPGKNVVQGVDILCFPAPDVYLIRYIIFHLYVIRYIIQNWTLIDIVFFESFSALWILPLRLLRNFNKKHPIFVMDTRTTLMEPVEKAALKVKIRRMLFPRIINLANRFADGQTAITERMANILCIPREKLWGTWPSGVNIEKFSNAVKSRHWPAASDPVNIIYIGTLNYERNLMTLCQAVIEANRLGMNIALLLYGEGTQKNDLEAFAIRSNGTIKVYDTIPHDQIPAVLAQAHAGALPFPDEEKYSVSSPIKLFEYMGSGMPILATKIVCHTDVIGSGDYVFWAENADVDGILNAIQQLWEARLTLSTLGEKALMAAHDWTWKASAKRLNDALKYGLSLYRK